MENNNVFSYQYSAVQNSEVKKIREKYLPKEASKIEQLKTLDAQVQRAGQIQSLTLGIIGCLIFGTGICFGLDVLAGPNWLAYLFGLTGVAVMLPAYPLFRYISNRAKAVLVPQILKLSEEIIKN